MDKINRDYYKLQLQIRINKSVRATAVYSLTYTYV